MPQIIFTHPDIDSDLVVATGANEISWAYNLNTVAYPTYAGEVVQVLSVNIDNLQIEGEIRSYEKMEEIYRWFLRYMQLATQGYGGKSYVEKPVKMEYPHRGWTLYIKPLALPGMTYGREVVTKRWQMRAHVEDPDPEQRALTIDHAINGDVENWRSRVAADIGWRYSNPFSDPLAVITKEEASLYPKAKDIAGIKVVGSGKPLPKDLDEQLSGLAKQMQAMFQALMNGEHYEFTTDASGPATTTGSGTHNKPSAGTSGSGQGG